MDDILFCIFNHLNLEDLRNCMLTSKQFNAIISNDLIWKKLFATDFVELLDDIPQPNNYHVDYRRRHTITKFCDQYSNCCNIMDITILNTAGTKMKYIPPEICLLRRLEYFDANNNKLKSIPKEIGLLTNLRQLYLHGNQLESNGIPDEIYTLFELRDLTFTNNPMKGISPKIGQLVKLERFYACHALLDSLPKEMGILLNLTKICATNNNLKSIPIEICHLNNLRSITLERNPLDTDSESIKILLQSGKLIYSYHQ